MPFKKVDAKVSFPKLEEVIIERWEKEKTFEQSVSKDAPAGDFIFYEGPPTANGKPGLHHVLARSFKDIIPRYKTMKGYRVARKAGWDTHGLPVELQVEKALGLKSKQEIENIVPGDTRASIIEFNKKCKESVWEYRDLWEKMTRRMGYWVDMEHPYVTYENSYIESVWWQIAQIADMKTTEGESFLYKGHKVVPYCSRCGTALSSHEVAQGYKTVKDLSVTVELELLDESVKTRVLAWTTTPWTLPGNVALAVNKDIDYVTIEKKDEGVGEIVRFIVAKDRLKNIFGEDGYSVADEYKGSKLVGRSYKPLFDYYAKDRTLKHHENGWKIYNADFVTTDVGTGIAHEAPAYGEDDMRLAQAVKLPVVEHVTADGRFKPEVIDFPGLLAKPKDNPESTDVAIIKHLAHTGVLFSKEKYEHEYPFCWRCDTPLIYFAKPSWFIRMSEVREALVEQNNKIGWVPEHIREGRFGEWLSGIRDWAISRERYWGTPIPVWECVGQSTENSQQKTSCGKIRVIASLKELEELSGQKLEDVHKPYIDDATWACDCGGTMQRTPEVMDVWFDSGAMPLAQFAYPHQVDSAVREKLESGKYFPADYICEAIDQTRGWFYTLHAIGTLLHRAGKVSTGHAFKNVICLGHVLDAEGKKMSKSKGNVIDPFEMFEEYGADPLRWMLFSLNQPGLPKRFDVKGMRDVQNRVFRMLWNSYSFFMTYAAVDKWQPKTTNHQLPTTNLLDRWILSELQTLIKDVDGALGHYDVYSPTKKIETFIDNLSNWYIRRSRKRFWKSEDDDDKEAAYQTLYTVLKDLSLLMAPFTPFITEEIYRGLTDGEPARNASDASSHNDASKSVHLADYPVANESLIDERLAKEMEVARFIVSAGLQERAVQKIKVRQPLRMVSASGIRKPLQEMVIEELNVKEYEVCDSIGDKDFIGFRTLDTNITPELRLEGEAREIIRAIQEGRKKAGFNVEDRIVLGYEGKAEVFEKFGEFIGREILATEMKLGKLLEAEYTETVDVDGGQFTFWFKRIVA